jgi:hypothetical protein
MRYNVPAYAAYAAIRNNPQAQQWIIAQTSLGRLGEAHDIGSIVALLCSDDARWLPCHLSVKSYLIVSTRPWSLHKAPQTPRVQLSVPRLFPKGTQP